MKIGRTPGWIVAALGLAWSGNLHAAESGIESVQIGQETIPAREPRQVWPSTKDLVDLPLKEFISKYPSSWTGHSLHDYFDLCKEVLNRPCSFEGNDDDEVWSSTGETPIRLVDTTPAKVLDAILRPYPNYHWVIRHDVINVEPIQPLKNDALSRKVDHLKVEQGSSFRASLDALDRAKIRWSWQSSNGTTHGTFARITLDLKNVTAREALNAIAREDGQIMWEYFPAKRSSKTGQDGTLFFPSYRKNGLDEHFKE